ncbi:MAG: ABC transporter ATP-binding protein [Geminicoccaceae bacterium]|nr:ABC transporter ATP-binding protein [Geminicoccaceae bacterium]
MPLNTVPHLELRGVTKRFGALLANDAIDLALDRGEVLALLGENGAGKTTLMSILFGHYVADEGSVLLDGIPLMPGSPRAALAAGIGMVHQHFTLADNLSVIDNIILGTEPLFAFRQKRRDARARIDALIAETGLEVPVDEMVGHLSIGEQQRVELLKALYRNASVLILDEPTAVLTPQQADRLFVTLRKLAAGGLGIIFISHKLDEVMALSSRVAVLRHGRKVMEARTADVTKAVLARSMVDREVAMPLPMSRVAGAPVLEMRGVSIASAREPLVEVDLVLHSGRVLGIAGVSGNGQRALQGLVGGALRPDRGIMRLDGRAWPGADPRALMRNGVGRIPEDRHAQGVVGDMAVWENMVLEDYDSPRWRRFGLLRIAAMRERAGMLVQTYDVRCDGIDTPTRLLSGGNMQKLILGRVLDRAPQLILAAQPTRGLDVGAVAQVHAHLLQAREHGAAILLISEDLDEILAISDEIAVIHRGRLSPPVSREEADLGRLGLMMAGAVDHAA